MDYATAFILGLAGSLHCAGMCGPLVLGLPQGSGRTFVFGRVAYNAGRVGAYALLGMTFGFWGGMFFLAGLQQALSIAIGTVLIVGVALSRRLPLRLPVNQFVNRIKTPMAKLLHRRTLGAQALLGFLNGFLPCGLVYVACAGAAAAGNSARGAVCMLLFGVGTIPMMLAIGLGGKLVPFALRTKLSRAVPISVLLLGTLLILRGLALGIPYLSPDLTNCACCRP